MDHVLVCEKERGAGHDSLGALIVSDKLVVCFSLYSDKTPDYLLLKVPVLGTRRDKKQQLKHTPRAGMCRKDFTAWTYGQDRCATSVPGYWKEHR